MAKVLGGAEKKLLEYGKKFQQTLESVLPVFDGLLGLVVPRVKNVVGLRQEVEDIQRRAKAAYLKSLIAAGATPDGAVQLLLQELSLGHEGYFKMGEMLCQVIPGLAQSIPSLLAQWAMAKAAMSQPKPTETPEA